MSALVDLAARRALDARRARAEAETLARLAADVGTDDPLHALVGSLRTRVPPRRRRAACAPNGDGWEVEAADGDPGPDDARRRPTPSRTSATAPCSRWSGPRLDRRRPPGAQRVRRAARRRCASAPGSSTEAATAICARSGERAARRAAASGVARPADTARVDQGRGVEPAPARRHVEQGRRRRVPRDDRGRSRSPQRARRQPARHEPPAGRRDRTDRCGAVHLEEVVPAALASLGERARTVESDVSESLPPVDGDAALLERVIANLVENALKWSPPEHAGPRRGGRGARPRRTCASSTAGPASRAPSATGSSSRSNAWAISTAATGVGLGLAVARGFVAAMGGELELEDTPGGGTTAIVTLKAARDDAGSSSSTTNRRSCARSSRTSRRAATTSTRPAPARSRCSSRPATGPTSSSSTSACPTSPAST